MNESSAPPNDTRAPADRFAATISEEELHKAHSPAAHSNCDPLRCLHSEDAPFNRYTGSMILRLLVASTNAGKLRDFRTAARAYAVRIDPLPGLDEIPAPAEDGDTFAANATLKAVYYSRFAPGELVLADDSGLEVDALSGAPGVRSSRFAADAGLVDSLDANDNTDVWNNVLLLQRMAGVPAAKRTARYHCVLVAASDGEVRHTVDGAVEGMILEAPRGTGGFGYDPLFYLPDLDKTMAEIDLETKLSLSHRGRAIVALLPMLSR